MSLVMALPAGQDPSGKLSSKQDKGQKQQQPGAEQGFNFSLWTMLLSAVFAVTTLAIALLWKQPGMGLLQISHLPDSNGTEQVMIGGSGIYYRPDSETVWTITSSGFGGFLYSDDHGKGLPDYAQAIAGSVGAARMILPALLVAYALGLLIVCFLGATTAVIAEMAGANFVHKHHHIYRPMTLKAIVCFLAYALAINMVALMVPWQIGAAFSNYQDKHKDAEAESAGGVWLMLLAFVFHLTALTAGFHLIAKQRMHLRHPAWVVAVHEHNRRRAATMQQQQYNQHAVEPRSNSTSSQETLVADELDKHSINSVEEHYNKVTASMKQSYGDQPYANQPHGGSYNSIETKGQASVPYSKPDSRRYQPHDTTSRSQPAYAEYAPDRYAAQPQPPQEALQQTEYLEDPAQSRQPTQPTQQSRPYNPGGFSAAPSGYSARPQPSRPAPTGSVAPLRGSRRRKEPALPPKVDDFPPANAASMCRC